MPDALTDDTALQDALRRLIDGDDDLPEEGTPD
jgi:hypothetical protein